MKKTIAYTQFDVQDEAMTTQDFIEWRRENPFTGDFDPQDLYNSQQEFLDRKYNRKQVNE